MVRKMTCKLIAITLALLGVIFLLLNHRNELNLIHSNQIPWYSHPSGRNSSGFPSTVANGTGTSPHGKYVSLCQTRLTGNCRTGNHLFMLAAMLHVARVTGRTLVMPRTGWNLDRIFQLDIPRYDDAEKEICPCKNLDLPNFDYDERFDDKKFLDSLTRANETLLVCSLSQTHRYAEQNEYELRRLLRFRENVSRMAESYLSTLPIKLTRIGVHVRRGDFLNNKWGLSVADANYFHSAFRYFRDRYTSVNFVVATQDRNWTEANLPKSTSNAMINFTDGETPAFDLAVLSKCDGVIMSTGSFGWWAAWLSKKTCVFYTKWPINGSQFDHSFNRENYFPSDWVPLL